ncbi:gliding motility-associated C-terminal domain-containing protein [Belliella sp. DSM 111904]|uniref:Gliding motility-associated C-terminal domain-containing protein n=1 Tax=Belliella filtrata TaxID=2923435 RepID=A0ABS9V083_9BACT|nr:gliding motility-associated C-terminal domain-containing protein [Belliella filtrata]MCH7409811.1 gliding motility-associated C-terminal domain-containing protein [Belliella filtrata]
MNHLTKYLFLFFLLITPLWSHAQFDREFARDILVQESANNILNAIDEDLNTFARINSSTGLALGIGASTGVLELGFPNVLPANTLVFIKIDFDIIILENLLGGTSGGLGSSLLDNGLFGNHTLQVQARNGNQVVLSGSTENPEDFAGDNLRIVVDQERNFYIQIRPQQEFQSIRLTDRISALLGLGNTASTDIFGAFIIPPDHDCITSAFTGINLQNFNLSNLLGVQPAFDVENILQIGTTSHSELNLTSNNSDAIIEQFVTLSKTSEGNTTFELTFKFSDQNIGTADLQRVSIRGFEVNSLRYEENLSDLISEEAIDLLQNGEYASVPFVVNNSVDRLSVSYARGDAGLVELPALQLAHIVLSISPPEISPELLPILVCTRETASLTANVPDGLLLRWYEVETEGIPLAENPSAVPFVTEEITDTKTYYVSAYDPVCDLESKRLPIEINVQEALDEVTLTITGNEQNICAGDDVTLTPTFTSGFPDDQAEVSFSWFFDEDQINEINHNATFDGAIFTIAENGELTISNINPSTSLEMLYLVVTIDNNCESLQQTFTTELTFSADCTRFSIEKTVDQPEAEAGETVTFSISVTNDGTLPITNLVITDVLSNLVTYIASSSTVQLLGNNTINWNINSLAVKQSITLTITVRLADDIPVNTIIPNTATGQIQSDSEIISSNTVEVLVIGNDDGDGENPIENENTTLAISKLLIDEGEINVGSILNYEITITNTGEAPALNINILDILPAELTAIAASEGGDIDGQNINWNLETLAPGDARTYTIQAMVQDGATQVSNTAQVSGDNFDTQSDQTPPVPVVGDDGDGENPIEDEKTTLAISKLLTDEGEINVGSILNYEITITNNGETPALNMNILDILPAELTAIAASEGGDIDGQNINWNLQTLAPGDARTYTIQAMVQDGATQVSNTAQVSGDNFDTQSDQTPPVPVVGDDGDGENPIEDEKTTLAISKLLTDEGEINVGSILNYEITITNTGETPALNMNILDILPAELTAIAASEGGDIDGQNINWNLETLAPGDARTYTIQAMVQDGATQVSNTAQVSGDNFDTQSDQTQPVPVVGDDGEGDINLSLEMLKTVSQPNVQIDQVFTYQIEMLNTGDNIGSESNLIVIDTLPEAVIFERILSGATQVEFDQATQTLRWSIPSLASGESTSISFEVRAAQASPSVVNTAFLIDNSSTIPTVITTSSVAHDQLEYKIANIVTPNGDGRNDTWKTQGLDSFLASWEVLIFNRYGIELYRSANYENDWAGDGLNAGTYFYQIKGRKPDGQEVILNGYITLIK